MNPLCCYYKHTGHGGCEACPAVAKDGKIWAVCWAEPATWGDPGVLQQGRGEAYALLGAHVAAERRAAVVADPTPEGVMGLLLADDADPMRQAVLLVAAAVLRLEAAVRDLAAKEGR